MTDDDLIGRAVVTCPGCARQRWHGYGPCSACGAPGTAEAPTHPEVRAQLEAHRQVTATRRRPTHATTDTDEEG